MSQNPPIEVIRSTGWTNSGWERYEPVLQRAATKAAAGLQYLGINYEAPKLARIRRFAPGDRQSNIAASAYDPQNFTLFPETELTGKLRAARRAAEWSSIMLHETVHCARFEKVPLSNLVEVAATEGLAYEAQRQYIAKFCGKQVLHSIYDFELDAPDPELREKFQEILETRTKMRLSHIEWFDGCDAHNYVRNGSLYGAQMVYQQVQKGYAIADLLYLEPEEVLGL